MAIAAGCVWEVRSTGSDSNGGGYVPGAGTDYSQQDAAQLTVADAAATGTTNLSSATGGFTAAMVNNIVNVVGQGRRQITAYVDANNVTCDAAWGTFSGATANVGGACASPGEFFGIITSGNTVWIQGTATPESSPYLISASSNVSGGRLTLPASVNVHLRGYLTSRGDITTVGGLRPVLKANANSVTIWSVSNNTSSIVRDLIFDGDKATRTGTVATGANSNWSGYNLTARNCASGGFGGTGLRLEDCAAVDNTGNGFPAATIFARCVAIGNSGDGFAGGSFVVGCLAAQNGGDGFKVSATMIFDGNTAYGNAGDGLEVISASNPLISNCVIYGNTGYGVRVTSASIPALINTAMGDNTAGATTGTIASEIGTITLTADPFTDAAGDDYSPNSAAGGGALIKGLVSPQTLNGTSTPHRADLGAAQLGGGGGGLVNGGLVTTA